jgi:hypothetical protein
MTVAAIVLSDPDRNLLGLPSHALETVAGRPVLTLTLDRLRRCPAIDVVAVIASATQQARVREAVGERPVRWLDLAQAGESGGRREMMRRGRKWSLQGWQGGLFGASVCDELVDPALLHAAESLGAETLVPVPAEWPWIDPALLAAEIEHHRTQSVEAGVTLSQAPPGLLPPVYQRERLADWLAADLFPGDLMRYHPDAPHVEFVVEPCFYQVPGDLVRCEARIAADTPRGLSLARRIAESLGTDAGAAAIGRLVAAHPEWSTGDRPREVELELTTRRPVADALRRLPPVAPAEMSRDEALRLVRETAAEDTLLTLGGRGDPLLHPAVSEVIEAARAAGVFGLHLVTYGQDLTQPLADLLVRAGVDVVTFLLDAVTPAVYAETKGGAALSEAMAGLERLSRSRRAADALWPLVAVEFVKTRRTLPEMEAFYDMWLRRGAWPVIRGPSDRAGQVADLAVVSMAPAKRTPCRRLFRGLTVLADGRVPMCDEDAAGRQVIGNALTDGLLGVWRGPALAQLRQAHVGQDLEKYPFCQRCREWHRS